jgi:hypothetical protein
MNLLRPLRWIILATSCVGIIAFGAAEDTSGWSVLLLLLAIIGWWLTEGRLRDRIEFDRAQQTTLPGLPRFAVNTLLLLAVPWAIWRARSGESAVSAFLSLLAVVLVLKLWERRDRSDYGQILTMAVFLTVGSTLNTNTFAIGLLLVLQIPLVLLGAMLLHSVVPGLIEHATLRSQRLAQPRAASLAARTPTRPRRSPMRAMVLLATITLLAATPLVVGIFITMPRSNIASLLGNFGAVRRVSGLASSVDLNAGGLISQSREIIATIRIEDMQGVSVGGLDLPQYLRAIPLDSYERGRWQINRERSGDTIFIPDADDLYNLRGVDAAGARDMVVQRVQNLTGTNNIFVALARPIALRLPETSQVSYNIYTGMLTLSQNRNALSYEVVSSASVLSDPDRSKRGTIDFDEEPGVQAIARDILGRAQLEPDPRLRDPREDARVVRTFETFLQTQFTYSLNTPVPASNQAITWFLTARPAAHCEFFASALAALARSVGIDARVMAGYLTSEYDPQAGLYTVRRSDAHAWVEAEIEPGKWAVYDGTPLASEEFLATRQGGVFDTFVRWLRNAEGAWNSAVVSFDQRRQSELLRGAPSRWLSSMQGGSPAGADLGEWRRQMRTASIWAMRIALGAMVVALVVFALSRLLRWWVPGRALLGSEHVFRNDPSGRALYVQVLAACAKVGASKPASVPLRAHVLGTPALAQHEALREATDLLYERAYSAAASTDFGTRAKASQLRVRQLLRTLARPANTLH